MSAQPLSVTPQSQVSHIRHLSNHQNLPAEEATRAMHHQAVDPSPSLPPLSAPASQESVASLHSVGSSVGPFRLQGSESDLSQVTTYTDATSSSTDSHDYIHSERHLHRTNMPAEDGGRLKKHHMLASPMSLTTNGAKRTASGHVKNAPSLPTTPLATKFPSSTRRARAESMSSTGSRAGDLASSLKTRLGYAMAKVQHGWEHRSIAEVEQLAAFRYSQPRLSMSQVDYSRPMTSGLSNGTSRLNMYDSPRQYPASPPSKRHSAHMGGHYRQKSTSALLDTPYLQPPVDLRPATSYRHHESGSQVYNNAPYGAMSPPRTPVNRQPRRPPTLRTDTQTAEAERDALQALFQLGSPHGSQVHRQFNPSQTSSSQNSPLRSEFATPRKVTFHRSESADSNPSSLSDASSTQQTLHPHPHSAAAPVEAYETQ